MLPCCSWLSLGRATQIPIETTRCKKNKEKKHTISISDCQWRRWWKPIHSFRKSYDRNKLLALWYSMSTWNLRQSMLCTLCHQNYLPPAQPKSFKSRPTHIDRLIDAPGRTCINRSFLILIGQRPMLLPIRVAVLILSDMIYYPCIIFQCMNFNWLSVILPNLILFNY